MASRLYPTTRRLFGQVSRGLETLGLGAVVSPLVLSVMALYITGLVLLDRRRNGTRIADWLPARAHDAINRLLRIHPISTRALMKAIRHWAKQLGSGYLAIDDVVVAKPFCWLNPWIGWTYCTNYYREQRWSVTSLGEWLTLKWRTRLGLRARSIVAYLPKYGTLRLVVTRNRQGNVEVLATNDLDSDLTTIVLRKRSRWSIETLFRDAKQFSGLAACQCRVDQALVCHVAFVLIGFVILQRLRLHPKETLGEVKDRLRREAMTGGLPAPEPLRGKVATVHLLTAQVLLLRRLQRTSERNAHRQATA
jgi:hypothetical protein